MSVVNLNKARKSRAKAQKKQRADENAARFGRSKSEKNVEKQRIDKKNKRLDGHKLDL